MESVTMINKITRREFIEGTTKMAAGLTFGNMASKLFGSPKKSTENGITVTIPMPIQVVIDDVGWWSGEDGHEKQEPYRTGINRNHVPADYQAIVDLGQALNIRPQAAMILGEWDTSNLLQHLPTSTWMGAKWDNKKWVGPWLEEARDIILNNKQYFEFTIHGIGHEYWSHGKFTRAEWADKNGIMRKRDQVEAHLDFYEKLMTQHDLGLFPTAFVPTAFLHSFGVSERNTVSMAEVLKRRGVSYINTPFEDMFHADRVSHEVFGFDNDVITVDRGHDLLSWKSIGEVPKGELKGPTCGLHWPNLLHPDPDRNGEIINSWVDFLIPYNEKAETLLARNSDDFCHQLVHHRCTTLKIGNDHINIDFSDVNKLQSQIGQKDIVLKIESPTELKFDPENIIVESESVTKADNKLLYTLRLTRVPEKKEAKLIYKIKS
jgi:hypothetical protein